MNIIDSIVTKLNHFIYGAPPKFYLEMMANHNTPDISDIERRHAHLIFVYDEMMPRHPYNDLVEPFALYAGAAYTYDNFNMYHKREGVFGRCVVVRPGQPDVPWGPQDVWPEWASQRRAYSSPVLGYLYLVASEAIMKIDKYKRNGVEFRRERVWVRVPHRIRYLTRRDGFRMTETIYTPVEACMYIATGDDIRDDNTGPPTKANVVYSPVRVLKSRNHAIKQFYFYPPYGGTF